MGVFYRVSLCLVGILASSRLARAQGEYRDQKELPEIVSTPAETEKPSQTESVPAPVGRGVSEYDQDSLAQLSLEDLLNIKVTVASREPETVSEAPSVVTVFKRDDIRRLGVRTVEQLLNYVPGFQSNSDESDHALMVDVRGRTSVSGESVLMIVDGRRVNDLFFGSAFPTHGIPTENIEQIEIIRGPGSALYGANAFLGVINIKTNRSRTDVTAGTGDMGRKYAVINAAKRYGDLTLASFVKLYTDEGQAYANVTDMVGRTVTAYDPVRGMDSSVVLEYRGLYFRTRYSTRSLDGTSCCSPYSLLNKYEIAQATVQAGYKVLLTEHIDLDTSAAFQRDNYAGIWPAALTPTGSLSMLGFAWDAWSVSPNADLQWRILSRRWIRATLMAGGSYARNRLSHYSARSTQDLSTGENLGGLYDVPGFPFGDPSKVRTRNVAAGYLQAKVDLWSRLTFTLGGRYDWYSDFGKSINPRAAVVWTTPLKSHVKLGYGRAFRAPTVFEAAGNTSGLKPETVQTLEVSYVQQVLDVAQVTADVFYQRLDNLIGSGTNGATFNAGHFTTKGIEFEIRTRDVYGARVLGGYTHLIRQADDPGITSKDFGSVSVDYAWNRLSANINSTIQGSRNQPMVDLYTGGPSAIFEKKTHALLNLRLQWEIIKGMRAFATVNNVLDYRYQPVGIGTTYVARGRTFLLGLSTEL